uniref:Uncharacterized protein n=1 Tax=Arundo donax TaxID=35708 RepID=A0A0A9C2I9_ARUDO
MVTTVARFKVGISWTRLYDIKVSCGSVNFFSEAGHNSTAGWPAVNCEAS